MGTEGVSVSSAWAVSTWNPQYLHIELLQADSSHLPTTTKCVQREGSFHRSRNWGPQMIISAHVSKSKENPSFMPDTAKSCLGHREIEARVSTLTKILE